MSSFINLVADHIKQHYDLQKEELTVVFPNKRAAFYLRSRFKEIYEGNIWMPQMLSIEEAVTQWSGLNIVDTLDLLFELIAIETEKGGSGDITVFGSMASQMTNDFDEIDQYAVDAQHLFSYIYEERKIGVWDLDGGITPREQAYLDFYKRLKGYYDQLRQRLLAQGKGYYGMIIRILSEMDGRQLQEATKGQRILFAGFNALTPTEEKMIDTLYKNGQAEVVWDFDQYYVEDPLNEAGHFARHYITKDVAWKPKVFSNHFLTEPKEIYLIGSMGNTIQAKALQSLLEVEKSHNPAVILANENLMIPVLNSIPNQERYSAIKVSMGYPMRQTALNDLISEFFTLHRKGRKVGNRGWYLWPVIRILSLEIVRTLFSKEEQQGINAFLNQVKEKTLFIYQEKVFSQYCTSPAAQQFMHLLLGKDIKEGELTPSRLLDILIDLLKFIGAKLQNDGQANTFLLNQVSEAGKVANRLKNILGRHQLAIRTLDEFEILYKLVNNNIAIKLNSSSIDGLQLMGILEARNLDFDTFYMLGVNEGILPADKSNGSFIPYNIRKECGLPDYHEKQAVYAYHFYRQLQGARKAYFIYNTNNNDSHGEPSRFLMQLKYELAQRNPNIVLVEKTFLNKTEPSLPSYPLFASKTPEVMEPLMRKIRTDRLHDALAPTSISTYITCPLKFFLKYIIKIKDETAVEETQDNDIGTVLHDTLEMLYRDHLNTLISPELFCLSIRPSAPQKLSQAVNKKFAQGLPDIGYNYLNKLNIDKQLQLYLDFEEEAIKKEELYVTNVEYTLHTILMVNGIPCVIAGKADRIERRGHVTRIIDYKTGKVKNADVKVPKNINDIAEIPEKALQLLIYKYLYLKEHPEESPDNVTASIYGLRMPQITFDLQVEDSNLNEHFIETMDAYLSDLLTRMMDTTVPFTQTLDAKQKPCDHCDYRDLCVNNAATASPEDDH
jgi:hypothetical protein